MSLIDDLRKIQAETGCSITDAKKYYDRLNGDVSAAIESWKMANPDKFEQFREKKAQEEPKVDPKEKDYQNAVNLKNAGKYNDSLILFSALKDYKDASDLLKECEEQIIEINYQDALKLKEEKQYETAKKAFAKYEDYKDSKKQIEEIDGLIVKDKYDSAIKFKEEENYEKAIPLFEEVKEYEDANEKLEECKALLEEANKEKLYLSCLFAKGIDVNKDYKKLEEAINKLKTIPGYKDADELVKKYEELLKQYQEEQAKKKAKKKKHRLIGGLLTLGILLLVGALSINYFVLLPNKRSENATNLLKDGKYKEAEEELDKFSLIQNKNASKIRAMSKAGQAFESGDYETGIEAMYQAGGEVSVKYNTDGGNSIPSKVIKKEKHINQSGQKAGYTFKEWTIDNFSFDIDAFKSDLALKANYEIKTYTISYNLNGGINDASNPSTYNVETDYVLKPASKEGYTFINWIDQGDKVVTNLKGLHDNLTLIAIYNEGDTYVVNLNPNGGQISSNKVNVQYGHDYTLPTPTRTGYTFIGWYDGNSKVTDNGIWNKASGASLEARWTPITYHITYNLNGGTNDANNPATYTVEDSIVLKAPSKLYYDFVEWRYNGSSITSIDTSLAKDITIEAIYTATTYNIKYNVNGGELPSGYVSSYNYESNDIVLVNPSREGYTFSGWYDNSDFNGQSISSIAHNSNGNKEYYAKWSANTYQVTYNLDGGVNNANNPITYTPDDNINLANPTKTGYTFLGWVDNENNPISTLGNGSFGNLTITAKWNDGDKYTVNLNPNGGSISQTSIQVQYDHTYSLPEPVRNGYIFDGWYEGDIKYDNSGTWNNTLDKTLVARYIPISYDITYNLMGGTNNQNNPFNYTIEDNLALYPASKKGYSFEGWYDTNNHKVESINAGMMGELTLTAHYNEGNKYTVTFNVNGGSLEGNDTLEVQYDHEYTLLTPTRRGYNFLGWYDGGNKIALEGTWSIDMDKTLKAEWQIITYTISYDNKGGQNNNNNPTTYTVESETINLTGVSKTGYNFVAWHDEQGHDITSIPKGSIGDRNLSAYFVAKNFVLTLDANGGECAYSSLNIVYNEAYTLPTPRKTGYTFDGWYIGSRRIYSSSAWTYTETNATAVARWSAVAFNITYVINDGVSNDPRNPSSYNIESNTITLYPLSKVGYTFLGWYDSNNNKVETIPQGSAVDMTLTARFNDGDVFTVTLDPNGGAFADTGLSDTREIEVQYDHTYFFPSVNKLGYSYECIKTLDGTVTLNQTGTWTYTDTKYTSLKYQYDLIDYDIIFDFTSEGVSFTGNDLTSISTTYGSYDSTSGQIQGTYTVLGQTLANDSSHISKPGYNFNGWYINNELVTSIPEGTTGTIRVEGKFTPKTLKISLPGYSDRTIVYGKPYTLPTPAEIDEGDQTWSIFTGWYYQGQQIPSSGDAWTYTTENATLSASWETYYELYYSPMYNGSNDPRNPYMVPHGQDVTLYPAIPNAGYRFLYWTDYYGNVITTLNVTEPDYTLVAHFEPLTYTLILLPEGDGSGWGYGTLPDDQTTKTVTYGFSYTLPIPTSDYSFVGWRTSNSVYVNRTGTWNYTDLGRVIYLYAEYSH